MNFEFRSHEAQPLIEKGQVLARQQFVVQPYQFPEITTAETTVKKEETVSYVKLETAGTALTIGKWSGWIDYLDVDGEPMLVDRQSVTPEFWRAPTDNDYGAWLQQRFAVWKDPQKKLKGVEVKANGAVATFEMPDVKATLTMRRIATRPRTTTSATPDRLFPVFPCMDASSVNLELCCGTGTKRRSQASSAASPGYRPGRRFCTPCPMDRATCRSRGARGRC